MSYPLIAILFIVIPFLVGLFVKEPHFSKKTARIGFLWAFIISAVISIINYLNSAGGSYMAGCLVGSIAGFTISGGLLSDAFLVLGGKITVKK